MGFLARKLRLHLLLIGLAGVCSAAELAPVTIRDFSPGLNTHNDSTLLQKGAAQDLQNVDVEDGKIRKRRGSVLSNSTPLGDDETVRFLHEFVSNTNTFWLLAVSSNSLYGSTDSGATFSLLTSTHGITESSNFQAANGFGNAYLMDGSTHTIVFDGSAVYHETSIPIGGVCAFFSGRLWVAKGSTLYGSRVSDATDWVDDGVDDADAFLATVRQNDGYSITAIKPFGPDLLVFKPYSIDRVAVLSDGLNFSLYPVTSHVGTAHAGSVATMDNAVVWLGGDGYYAYDGSQIRRISEKITPTINSITQLDAQTRSYSETTMTSGTHTYTTSDRVAGQVMLKTSSSVDTSQTDFAAGTAVDMDETVSSGNLYLGISSDNVIEPSFESSCGSWTGLGTGYCSSGLYASADGTKHVGLNTSGSGTLAAGTIQLRNSGGVLASKAITNSGYGYWQDHTFDTSSFAGYAVTLRFVTDAGNYIENASRFICSGDVITFSVYRVSAFSLETGVDYFRLGRSTITTGSFTSQTFDTGVTANVWKNSPVTITSNGYRFTWKTQNSSDGSSWSLATTWTPDDPPNYPFGVSSVARYIRYTLTIDTGSGGIDTETGRPFVSDATLNTIAALGRYTSETIDTSAATSWLPFSAVGSSDGGGLSYELYSDTDTSLNVSDPSTFTSSQTITSGSVPTIGLDNYAVLSASMSSTGVPDPYVEEWALQWGEGSVSSVVSSVFWKQDYYSAVSFNGTNNDTILIYDRNGAWTIYKDLPTYYLATYRNFFLGGLYGGGDVIRLQVDGEYSDYDGSAIDAYWISKDFDLGHILTDKTLLRYYLTGLSNASGNVTFEYGVNRGSLTGSSYSLNQTGFFRQVINPSSLTYSRGIQHRFKISDSTLDAPFSILSITGKWRLETDPVH